MSINTTGFTAYRKGTKAFIDGFGGAIPCTIVEVHKKCNGRLIGPRDELTVEVTETKGGYTRGEREQRCAAYTPPFAQRYVRDYFYRINVCYEYLPDEPATTSPANS